MYALEYKQLYIPREALTKTRKADGIRRRWCKSSRPPPGRALMGNT